MVKRIENAFWATIATMAVLIVPYIIIKMYTDLLFKK